MKNWFNFAPKKSSKDTLIDMLKEARLPCHNSEIILHSLQDDLGVEDREGYELEAVMELAGWLELIYDFEDLTEEEKDNTMFNLSALGADVDNWSVKVIDTAYMRVELTPLLTVNGFQFDVAFKRDEVKHWNGIYTYPPTISGVIASRSMLAHIENFAMYLKLYKL